MRSYALSSMIDELENIHYSFDNFYHEGPKMRDIMSYVNQSNDIPDSLSEKLLSVVLVCRLGNSYGVANSAVPYYDELLKLINQDQVKVILKYLYQFRQELNQSFNDAQDDRLKEIVKILASKTYTSDRVKEAVNYLYETENKVSKTLLTPDYRRHIELL